MVAVAKSCERISFCGRAYVSFLQLTEWVNTYLEIHGQWLAPRDSFIPHASPGNKDCHYAVRISRHRYFSATKLSHKKGSDVFHSKQSKVRHAENHSRIKNCDDQFPSRPIILRSATKLCNLYSNLRSEFGANVFSPPRCWWSRTQRETETHLHGILLATWDYNSICEFIKSVFVRAAN